MNTIKINKEQREGWARICDNLSTLATATFVAGIFGRGVFTLVGLAVCFFVLLGFGYFLRRDKK